jgi:hypothetical protein
MRVAAALALAFMFVAVPARAEKPPAAFGASGQLIVSADRMFGLSFATVKTVDGTTSTTDTVSSTDVSAFWVPGATTPYELPRVSFDYVAALGITVGGSVGFFSQSSKQTSQGAGISSRGDGPSASGFQLAPRIGYVLPLSGVVAFWPRAGVTYYRLASESANGLLKTTMNGLGVNVESTFAFSIIPGFAVIAGPVLDLPISGSLHLETPAQPARPDDKHKFTNWGLALGLLGYF